MSAAIAAYIAAARAALDGIEAEIGAVPVPPPVPTRRTLERIEYTIGALTPAGFGAVALVNIGMVEGAEPPLTWEVGSEENGWAGHWALLPGRTPIPRGGFPSSLYEFPATAIFADGTVEKQTLVITIKPDTVTFGEFDLLRSLWAATGPSYSGMTFEIATGADLTGAEWSSGRMLFDGWRFDGETFLRDADRNRPSRARSYEFRNCRFITHSDLVTGGPVALPTPINARFYYVGTGDTLTEKMRAVRPRVYSEQSEWAGFFTYAFRFSGCDSIVHEGAWAARTYGGITQDDRRATNIVFDGGGIRYFSDNAVIWGNSTPGTSSLTLKNFTAMSPMRAGASKTHLDGLQISDTARGSVVTIDNFAVIQADGDAFCQGLFSNGGNASGADACTLLVNGFLYVGRAYHALTLGASNNCEIDRVTLWKTDSGDVATSSTEDDSKVNTGPWFLIPEPANRHSGKSRLSRAILFGTATIAAGAPWTPDKVFAHGGTRTKPPINTGFEVADPKALLDGIDYASMPFDAIETAVRSALRTKPGGPYGDAGA